MASSSAQLYRKPATSTSGKGRSSLLFTLAARIDRSTLPLQARNVLLAQLRASNNDFGTEIFPANIGVAVEGRISYITARRWAKRMCQEIHVCGRCGYRGWLNAEGTCPKPRCRSKNVQGTGRRILKEKHGCNWLSPTGVRRPVTYEIDPEAIPGAYETYAEFKRRTRNVVSFRRVSSPIHRRSVPATKAEPQIQSAASPATSAAPPLSQPSAQPSGPKSRQLTRSERKYLAERVPQLMKTGNLAQDAAIAEACRRSLTMIPVASALAAWMRSGRHGFKADDVTVHQDERGPCTRHPDSGLTPWGTCYACYSERCGYKPGGGS